jgi:hypothetical protein
VWQKRLIAHRCSDAGEEVGCVARSVPRGRETIHVSEGGMRVLTVSLVGAAALGVANFGSPASADNLKSVVRTLNAIVNPEDAWRLEDQARRYRHHNEERYWHGYAAGLEQQRRERGERVPEYHGWDRYERPIDPDEARRLEDQARRFGHPRAQDYWRRYQEGDGR